MSLTPSTSFLTNGTPSMPPPRSESQDFYTSLYHPLVLLEENDDEEYSTAEEDEEYYTAEEDETSSDSEDSNYIPFDEIFGDVESLCSEEEEAEDAEFERRQALLESRYGFDENRGDDEPEFEDPFGGYSEQARSLRPPATINPSIPSADFAPHFCNCPDCPSRTEGFIPPPTTRSVNTNIENLPSQRTDNTSGSIPPLILTPSTRRSISENARALPVPSGPSRRLGDLDLDRHSEGRNNGQNTLSRPAGRHHDLRQTVFNLPSIRTLDIWYDNLPGSPSQATSEVPTRSSRMALSFILNSSLAATTNQSYASPVSSTRTLPEMDYEESEDTADDIPWLSTFASTAFDVTFIPDCSNDLIPYSLSLTRNVRTAHPSRDSNHRFANLDFPGPLELRD